MTKSNRGFTLIELLVVIAIIGILSSVVLASLNTARAKGQDAAIKSQLGSLKAQAALYYDNQSTPTYVGMFADPTVVRIMNGIISSGGTSISTSASSSGWAAASKLVANSANYFCTDGNGVSTTTGSVSNIGSSGCI